MITGRLLIIGLNRPEPNATAAGHRMMQLIRCFGDAGYEICFASTSIVAGFGENQELYGMNFKLIRLNDSAFDEWLLQWMPQLVLFDRFMAEEQFGWRVAKNCPDAIRILDTEDLHSLRISREEALNSATEWKINCWLQHTTTLRELASIFRCDLSLVTSSYEVRLLQEEAGIAKDLLLHLPFMLEAVSAVDFLPFNSRSGFIFIGNGKHKPNADAVKWLREAIWPGIRRQLPEEKMEVYGAYLPAHIQALDAPAMGFHIRGWVQDAFDVIGKSRVQLAPLRFGAGIKGKLTDSMICGTPSVTTPVGAEGMHESYPWSGFVALEAEEIVKAAVKLYTDAAIWNLAQKRGEAIINNLYSKTGHRASLLGRIKLVQEQLPLFRSRNLIGAMLMHHRMASTKYLSKWIEAKNKLLRK